MNKLKVASLFAGVGGICIGFKNAGAEVVWANELDEYACRTYRKNLKETCLVQGDVKKIDTNDIPDFDILTAGFPCQAFSVAGYRKGFKDDRGNLFFEILRFLINKKPSAFLLENVKNLYGHDKGNTFKVVKEALISEGYHIKYKVMNSCEYGNIPQTRERIYIVGFKDAEMCRAFSFPEKIPLTKTIHDIIDISDKKEERFYYKGTKYYEDLKLNMTNKNTVYQIRRVYIRENKSNMCPTLTANMGGGGHNVPLIIDNYDIRKLTPKECFLFQGFPPDFIIPEGMSNMRAYTQAGNSVTVPVVERIAKIMISAINNSSVQEKLCMAESIDAGQLVFSVE